jgi:hypothetical protein
MRKSIFFVFLLSAFLIPSAYTQKANKKIKISGTVVDKDKRPLEGILILIDGVKTDVSTNSRGEYKVRILPESKTITMILMAILWLMLFLI